MIAGSDKILWSKGAAEYHPKQGHDKTKFVAVNTLIFSTLKKRTLKCELGLIAFLKILP